MKTLGERAMDFLIEHEEYIGDDGFCVCCGYDMVGGSPHTADCELGRLIGEIKRERERPPALTVHPLGFAVAPLEAVPRQYAEAGRIMAKKLDKSDLTKM